MITRYRVGATSGVVIIVSLKVPFNRLRSIVPRVTPLDGGHRIICVRLDLIILQNNIYFSR